MTSNPKIYSDRSNAAKAAKRLGGTRVRVPTGWIVEMPTGAIADVVLPPAAPASVPKAVSPAQAGAAAVKADDAERDALRATDKPIPAALTGEAKAKLTAAKFANGFRKAAQAVPVAPPADVAVPDGRIERRKTGFYVLFGGEEIGAFVTAKLAERELLALRRKTGVPAPKRAAAAVKAPKAKAADVGWTFKNPAPRGSYVPKPGTVQATVINLATRKGGATSMEIEKAAGWSRKQVIDFLWNAARRGAEVKVIEKVQTEAGRYCVYGPA